MQDEVLASRLGLIPLKGGKEGLNLMTRVKKAGVDGAESVLSDYNTVIMELKIECKWRDNGLQLLKQGETDPEKLYENPNGKRL